MLIEQTMLQCKLCSAHKPDPEFYPDQWSTSGYKSWCKVCCRAKAKEPRAKAAKAKYAKTDKGRAVRRKSIRRNWPARLAYAREYQRRPEVSERRRQWAYYRKYGITIADYDRMLLAQSGRCAICTATKPGGRCSRFHVDHCHETGKVRGLLCNSCNTTLGYARDSVDILHRAIEYLQAHR